MDVVTCVMLYIVALAICVLRSPYAIYVMSTKSFLYLVFTPFISLLQTTHYNKFKQPFQRDLFLDILFEAFISLTVLIHHPIRCMDFLQIYKFSF